MDGLDRRRFRPVLIAPGAGAMTSAALAMGIVVYDRPVDWWIRADPSFTMSRLNIESNVVGILDVIDREQPDIVHTNTSVVVSGGLAARRRGLRHVWHLHEVLDGHTELRSVFPLDDVYRIINSLSDRVVTVSRAQRAECSMIDTTRLRTINNGVPRNLVTENVAQAVRDELGIDDDRAVVTSVGSIIPRKGHTDLIEAAAIARRAGTEARYIIVGRGAPAEVARLRSDAVARGVDDIVSFIGFRPDVAAVLAASDILAHPSRNEALPTTVLEAMAAGLAVVATDCGGTRELVVDGETGLVIPVARPDELARALATLIRDEAMRIRFGTSGRRRFEQHFSLELMVGSFELLYSELLAGPSDVRTDSVDVVALVSKYERAYMRSRAFAKLGRMFARPANRP